MRKFIIISLSILAFIIAVAISVNMILFFNPLLKSSRAIRADILRLTPIGMSMDEVRTIIEINYNWRIRTGSSERGYVNPHNPPETRVVGEKHITADLGRGFLLIVSSSWGFDKNGKLIDVYVEKYLAP